MFRIKRKIKLISTMIVAVFCLREISSWFGDYLQDEGRHYDVIINGYMRSGSTLTGTILGHREDAFYVYEPFWRVSRFAYWRDSDTVCRSDRTECRRVAPYEAMDTNFVFNKFDDQAISMMQAMRLLREVINCDLNGFERLLFEETITARLGGPIWGRVSECMNTKTVNDESCIGEPIKSACTKASHRVFKILRLSLKNYESILEERENLKLIHLFRDPRAIINSRINTDWYNISTTTFIGDAESLCNRMLEDFKEGLQLMSLYPNRVKFLFYEDMLLGKSYEKVKVLYEFAGMSLNKRNFEFLKDLTVLNEDSGSAGRFSPFWWRSSLPWKIVRDIDTVCYHTLDILGYKTFKNKYEFYNFNITTFKVSPLFQLG